LGREHAPRVDVREPFADRSKAAARLRGLDYRQEAPVLCSAANSLAPMSTKSSVVETGAFSLPMIES
jgi:hypothetical protein